MSWNAPQNLNEVEFSTAHGWSFTSTRFGLSGHTSAVLSSTKHLAPGAFADKVAEDQRNFTARYMSTGDRTRKDNETIYYVTRGAVVVAYLTTGGEFAIDNELLTKAQRLAIHRGLVAQIERNATVYADEREVA